MTIGYAMCGSFCTLAKSFEVMKELVSLEYEVLPIMSERCYATDTRFGKAQKRAEEIESLCQRKIMHTVVETEALGPAIHTDVMVIAPCTGNTLAKLALGITDSALTMAAKAHLRNSKPLVIALATNDALSSNLKNIGHMMEKKNIYFVPLGQDDPIKKPYSMVADFTLIPKAINAALESKQLHPLFI